MAQEDKGLVVRGLLLLTFIGGLVTIVLGFMFWRTQAPPPIAETPPEHAIAALVAPQIGAFPGGVSWYAIFQASETLPSAPGFDVRYNAATTLARRGSSQVPWDLLREMLDEKLQKRNNRVKQPDGQYVYDEAAARRSVLSSLRAIAAWHEKQSDKKHALPAALSAIYSTVDELAKSPFVEVKTQAEKARATFFR
jgi:hypothetical protein